MRRRNGFERSIGGNLGLGRLHVGIARGILGQRRGLDDARVGGRCGSGPCIGRREGCGQDERQKHGEHLVQQARCSRLGRTNDGSVHADTFLLQGGRRQVFRLIVACGRNGRRRHTDEAVRRHSRGFAPRFP